MWPGFGDNMRVLEWILKRCDGTVEADETAIGYVPKAEDIDLTDLDYEITEGKKFGIEELKEILVVDKEKWAKEAEEIEGYYNGTVQSRIPAELTECLEILKKNCAPEPKKAAEPKAESAEPKKAAAPKKATATKKAAEPKKAAAKAPAKKKPETK